MGYSLMTDPDVNNYFKNNYWPVVLLSLLGFILFTKCVSPFISSHLTFINKYYSRLNNKNKSEWNVRYM